MCVCVRARARSRYICPRDDDTRWLQCRKIIIFHAQSLAVRRQVQKVNTPETRRDRFQNVFTVKFSDHFRNDQKVVLLFNFGLTAHTSPLHTARRSRRPSMYIYECVTVYFDVSSASANCVFFKFSWTRSDTVTTVRRYQSSPVFRGVTNFLVVVTKMLNTL